MMKQKRRFFGLILAICLMTGLFPTAAMAEGEAFQIWIAGVQVTEDNCNDVLAGTENAGKVSFDSQNKILTLNSLQLAQNASRNGCIYIKESGVTIRLTGENYIEEKATKVRYNLHTVNSTGDLTFDGTGSLSIKNGTSRYDVYGIYCLGILTINGGEISIETGDSTATKGIYNNQAIFCSGKIDISGGKLKAVSGKALELSAGIITAAHDITIENAEVYAQAGKGKNSYGMYTNKTITISNNAKVTGTGGEAQDYSDGIVGGIIDVNNSEVTASGAKGGAGSYGISADNKLTLKNKKITAESGEAPYSVPVWCPEMEMIDGKIDAKGGTATSESYGISAAKFTMTDGEIRAEGGDATDWSIGLWSNNAEISGGSITAIAGQANGTNAITVAPTFFDYKVVVKAGDNETNAAKVTSPTEETYLNNHFIRIEKFTHEHVWSESFAHNADYHWHICEAQDCDVADISQNAGYAAHVYEQKIVSADYKSDNNGNYFYSCACGAKGTKTFTAQGAVAITTTVLPSGTVDTAYSQTLTATGSSPITWSIASGSLPNGLTLSGDGVISGKPTVKGSFTFTVKAENSVSLATQELTITVNAASEGDAVVTPVIEDSPKTGDSSNINLMILLMVTGLAGLAVCTVILKKHSS